MYNLKKSQGMIKKEYQIWYWNCSFFHEKKTLQNNYNTNYEKRKYLVQSNTYFFLLN